MCTKDVSLDKEFVRSEARLTVGIMKAEKFLGLIGIVSLFFFGIPIHVGKNLLEDELLFKEFISKYNKSYNDTEYKTRFDNFKVSLRRIAELNGNQANNESALYGLTEFSDLSQDEFLQYKLQRSIKQLHYKHTRHRNHSMLREKRESLPSTVDWRKKGVVGVVHDQQSCGSCWAFSVIQTVESMNAIKTGTFVDLSVQQMIDCARYGNYGCDGGDSCALLDWLYATKTKITTEKSYPYTHRTETCKTLLKKTGVQIKAFTCEYVADEEEEILADLAFHGPVVAIVNAITWQYYLGGVIEFHCSNELYNMNHAVQIVGYDTTGRVPYYIVKNSWGPSFGNKGYVYLAIGKNICGVANVVSSLDVV